MEQTEEPEEVGCSADIRARTRGSRVLPRPMREDEAEAAFINFMRMPSEMFDELLDRISLRITKQHTSHARRAV